MYCPSCGSEQANNSVRFCYRCRFQLGGVTDLLNNQGRSPYQMQQPPPVLLPPQPLPISQRKKGMKNGAKLMFISAVLTPIFFAFAVGVADHPGPLIVPFTVFLAGLCWMVYSAIFGEDYAIPQTSKLQPPFVANPPPPFTTNPPRTALPTADNYHVTMPPQRVNTSEMVDPPSVTEHTTNLLEKK
jgi:hypothetical protein